MESPPQSPHLLHFLRHLIDSGIPILLDEAKTQLVDATQASFKFRGFTIQMSRRASTGKPYPNVRPEDKSLKKTKARLTGRNLTATPLSDILGSVTAA
ncbi:hypothetical protein [Accumulibacter sp.]|uniref:hypothetical protein n=1 Tax=Accumulibacter sp. TaxID=2053492 RepID=UPI00258C4192|nr:hypothetical protein [Accumulibacter sp.]